MDDVPLKLFTDRQAAERYADAVSREQIIDAAERDGRDVSIVFGVDIYTLDAGGNPTRHQGLFKEF